jgi:phenylpropionate dioxygenase-like ring-hydroxylating dioxygenase large terminal subunit
MDRATELSLIERLLTQAENGLPAMGPDETRLDVGLYRSIEQFELERRILFRRRPIIVAPASQVSAPGDVLSHDALGVPLLVTRDRTGALRAFLNVCRHRGSRLVIGERERGLKGLVCGYHGWTYGLDGALLHIPHEVGFPRTDCDRNLVPVPVQEHGGFVWVIPTPGVSMDLAAFLGPLAAELDSFQLSQHTVFRSAHVRRRCNWKLLIDAFLDGYHIRQLHRASVYRFFLDNVHIAEPIGPHIRSVVARRELRGARQLPKESWRYRDLLSLTYMLFPNTVLVFHPDWVSRITLFPIDQQEMVFSHDMLIPPGTDTDEHRPHWDKTWKLIHETVFEREDLVAAEWIQGGLSSGANDTFSLGRYEHSIQMFHDALAHELATGT